MQRGMLQPEAKAKGCRRKRAAGGYIWVKASGLQEGDHQAFLQTPAGHIYLVVCSHLPI